MAVKHSAFQPVVTDVVPFSYRDGDTYLEIIADLEDATDKCVSDVIQMAQILNEYVDAIDAIPNDIQKRVDEATIVLKRYIKKLIEALETATVAEDPVWGLSSNLDRVLADMYNNLSDGLTAYEFDHVNKTAAAWDTKGATAREYDLYGAGESSDVRRAAASDAGYDGGTPTEHGNEILGLE